MSNQGPIRVAVVGVGAFGKNHARVYHELQKQRAGVELVAVVDSDPTRAKAVAREFRCAALTSPDELRGRVDAASVAAPTIHHMDIASRLMTAGIDVLVEKPLASTVEEADELIRLAKVHQRIAQAGHLERFNPAVRATLPLITRPMFFEVHRLSIFTPRSLDVDVVLDLMIHDIDVVLTFVRSPVKDVRAVGLAVVTPKVDIANVRLEFESGCVANLTASRVSTERVRKLRFFQPHEYISVDYGRQEVMQFAVTGKAKLSLENLIAKAVVPIPGVSLNRPKVHSEEPLHAELKSFVDAVRHRTTPLVPLEDGRSALSVAMRILGAIEEHSRQAQLNSL
ncbi:MAG TPA: Gfo/Idh/MocA family oxidoreductase [Verrucomicrobiae bacterium]|nr:Gfo/Idh/MocA family oxidoreductase [Verrucomicrobiae bacterium]